MSIVDWGVKNDLTPKTSDKARKQIFLTLLHREITENWATGENSFRTSQGCFIRSGFATICGPFLRFGLPGAYRRDTEYM